MPVQQSGAVFLARVVEVVADDAIAGWLEEVVHSALVEDHFFSQARLKHLNYFVQGQNIWSAEVVGVALEFGRIAQDIFDTVNKQRVIYWSEVGLVCQKNAISAKKHFQKFNRQL